MSVRETLTTLAAAGHSRTSAHKALGLSWYTFRQVAADYPEIQWRTKGKHCNRKKEK
jgi:ABC-type sulfate transport system permease subunit